VANAHGESRDAGLNRRGKGCELKNLIIRARPVFTF